MENHIRCATWAGIFLLLGLLAGTGLMAQSPPGGGEYRGNNVWYQGAGTAEKGDVSPPLRDLVPLQAWGKAENEERSSNLMGPCGPMEPFDPVAQTCLPDGPTAMPAPGVSFDGFTTLCGCSPPDPVGDVGPNHYVAMANSHFAVYDKTGVKLYPTGATTAAAINTIWTGFGGPCETENAGDPVVLYDQLADRWLMSQFTAAGPTYYNCVCLSTTNDPTGSWQRYAFKTPIATGANFPDYPKYGVWPDAYYISTREFDSGGSFAGVGAYALNRSQMLAGNLSPQVVSFLAAPGSTSYNVGDGLLPADLDGTTLPAAGTPEFYIGTMDNGGPYLAPQDAMTLWKFHVDWATPASSTFTLTSTIPVAAFDSTFPPCSGRSCIPQPGTTNKVDILSYRQRPLHRAAYRNFGDHQSIVTNQSVAGTATIAGIRWYELRDPNGTPAIYQQGTYVPGATDSIHRWMASTAMDKVGDMAIGFSASSSTSTYPSVWYTGRLVSDALGTMPQGEGVIVNGTASQTSSQRWGDYTSINVDPTNDCTFWYVNQYFSAADTWKLRIGSFTFPSCLCAVTPAAPLATGASASADNHISVNWNDAAAPSITRYFVYRSTVAGGPYTQIATVPDSSPGAGGSGVYAYDDNPVSGGTRYYYVIKADDGVSCTSANSVEVNALATGPCLLSPTFAGLTAVTNPGSATCTLNLTWGAGAALCSGPLTYNVYRSTITGFAPAPINRIATGVSGTSYVDMDMLTSGTRYYYVVRAVDSSNGTEETNTAEKSGVPTGTYALGTFAAGAETGDPAMTLNTPWTASTTYKRTGTYSYSTGATYPTSVCTSLVTPSLTLGTGSVLTYYHIYSTESGYDGGRVEISTNNGSTWTALTPTPAYPGTITSSGNACSWATTTACYIGTSTTYPTAWQTATVNLGPTYDGQTVLIRWRFTTDSSGSGSGTSPGWYIDDINLTNVMVPGTCATGSACANNPSGVNVTPDGPLTLCAGSAQVLTATPTGGSGLSYQWYDGATLLSGETNSTYTANTTGTHTYNCRVTGSGCTSAMADGAGTQITWQAAPTFAGVASVTTPGSSTCTLSLTWPAASTVCPGPVTYRVYRNTSSPFTPGPTYLIASGVTGTSYSDAAALAYGSPYYYIVRAYDAGTGLEDANTVTLSGTPTGPISTSNIADDFEAAGGFDTPGWTHAPVTGATDWAWSTALAQSPTHSWFAQDISTVNDKVLVSPAFGVLATTTMTFYHRYTFEGTTSCFDGGTLEYAIAPYTTWTVVPDAYFTANGFNGTAYTGYSNPIAGKRAWCFSLASWTQVSVNLSALNGQTIKIRWHEGDDSSTASTGWYVDTVRINNAGTAGSCTTGSGVNPKEASPSGNMTSARGAGNAVNVTYTAGCGATDHVAYWTKMTSPAISSLAWGNAACGLGTSGSASFDPGSLNAGEWVYFVVVAQNATKEGSYGKDSAGTERPEAVGVGTCDRTQDLTGTCP